METPNIGSRNWDVWQDKNIVDKILPALGTPDGVFGGERPSWFPDCSSILDIGCGNGMFYPLLSSFIPNYTGIDSSEFMIQYSSNKFQDGKFMVGDLFNIPFENETFEMVFSNAVFIHIPIENSTNGMKEMMRVSSRYICFNCYQWYETFVQDCGEVGILQVWGINDVNTMFSESFPKTKIVIVEDTPVEIGGRECRTVRYLIDKKKRRATTTKDSNL